MSKGYTVDPALVEHAADRTSQAIEHFEKHGAALDKAQLAILNQQALHGGYGDAGYFYHACDDFATEFNLILGKVIGHNGRFLDTARRILNGLQTASKVYREDDLATGEKFGDIDKSYGGS